MSDYDSKIIRKQIRVYGSVQGVGFRYRTEHAAESVGATGWVRNDPDGSVFMEIQGTEEQIDRVFAMVSQGTYVNIEKMDAKSIPVVGDERGFHTREIRVYGSVQGVGFRYRTEHAAESVGATGWVRNDPDGSVFMEIQGTEEQIDRVFAMVSQGTYVNIEKMDAKSIPVVGDERGFHTRESLGDFWGLWHR